MPWYNFRMAIDHTELAKHKADYEKMLLQPTDKFVCPIMYAPVNECDLINGHILNEGFSEASRKTVIQSKRVDHFYGSHVEPALINHMELFKIDPKKILEKGFTGKAWVKLDDGSLLQAIPAESTSGKKAAEKAAKQGFLIFNGVTNAGDKVPFVIPKKFEKPPVIVEFYRREVAFPLKWVAAMLKAGYLAMFLHFGYWVLIDSMLDTLRRSLKAFAESKGSEADVQKHFGDFENSVRIIEVLQPPRNAAASAVPFAFDTLNNRVFLCARTLSGRVFTFTCLFQINGLTVGVTMPSSLGHSHIADDWSLYQRLLAEDSTLAYTLHTVQFDGDKFQMSATPLNQHYIPAF